MLFRHFVRTEEGAIRELDENSPFTVDDYPLLENWPIKQRQNLATDSRSFIAGEELFKEGIKDRNTNVRSKENPDEPMQRALKRDNSSADNSDLSFSEPQVILVKGQ